MTKLTKRHTYTPPRPGLDTSRWDWYVENAHAGCNLWINENKLHDRTVVRYGGIELHRKSPSAYAPDDAPSHSPCPYTNVPCWHDGSSHAAEQAVEMHARAMLDHETAFAMAEAYMDQCFETA